MFELSQNSAILVLSLTLGVYFLVNSFGETKRLAHIPTIGYSDPILSYLSALHFQFDPPGFLRKGWQTIKPGTKYVKVPGFMRWTVVGVSGKQYQDVVHLPEHTMSILDAVDQNLLADFTLFQDEIRDRIQIPVIVNKLNRSLGQIVPEIHEEVVAAFAENFPLEDGEWKSFVLWPQVMKIIGTVSNRALVGLPLCRNMDYINANVSYAEEVLIMTFLLSATPKFLRPFVNWVFSPVPRRVKQITGHIQPIINARREGLKTLGEKYEMPLDFLTWLVEVVDELDKAENKDRDVILRMMTMNFASIHTTSLTFTNAIFALGANPQHIEPLRAEVERCIEEEGWTKAAMDKMYLLDFFMKESQRLDVITALGGQRMAAEDCMLSGTFIPKGTMVAVNVLDAHQDESVWGPNPSEFNPSRFSKIEKETGKRYNIVTTSPNLTTFGHGRHACPGRFFAAQEMKLLMTYILLTCDIKLDTKDGARPKSTWIGLFCLANQSGRIMLRKRAKRTGGD